MRIFKFFKKSKGFTLVEISIVLLIASILMIGYTRVLRDINQDDKSAAIAAHLVTVTGGVNTYISSNFNALVAGTAITGVANPLAPTVTELKTTGYLAQNVKTTNLAGTNWLTQINLTPAGCVAPACDLNAIVYSDKGFFNLSSNKPDWMLASRVAGKVGGEGATSLYSNTTVISGEGGTWTTPNPVAAANAAAVVAMRTGYGSQGFSQFVRNGDMRNITLNGNLGVNGASGVSATQGTFTNLAATTAAISGNLSVGGNVAANGSVTGSTLRPTSVVTVGAACSPNGQIATQADGTSIVCISGEWTSPASSNCVNTIFCNTAHGSYFFPAGISNFTVPAGVKYVQIYIQGGNGVCNGAGTGSFLKLNGAWVVISGGGGAMGISDAGCAGGGATGGYNGAAGAGGGGWNWGGGGGAGWGGGGGASICGSPASSGGGGFANGQAGWGGRFWGNTWGFSGGGHSGGASLEDFAGGYSIGGGGGYGGGGGGSIQWCGYSYSGGGGGGGGLRSGSITTDFIFNKDGISVNVNDILRAGFGNYSGYANLKW